VVFLAGRGHTRYVQQIARVTGHDERGYQLNVHRPRIHSFAYSGKQS